MIPLLQTAMPPSNLAYLIAAFAVTGVALIVYVYFIYRRRQETRVEIDRLLDLAKANESAGREVS